MSFPKQATVDIHVADELRNDNLLPATVQGVADVEDQQNGPGEDLKGPGGTKEPITASENAHQKLAEFP